MNKITKISAIGLTCLSLIIATGCKQTKAIGDKFINDSKNTYDNAAKAVNNVKDATVQKVNDIEDAAKKIKDASDAIQKVTDSPNTQTPAK